MVIIFRISNIFSKLTELKMKTQYFSVAKDKPDLAVLRQVLFSRSVIHVPSVIVIILS